MIYGEVSLLQENVPASREIKRMLGPSYTDAFSNRSVFILLRFQIVPLWTAFSNVRVFMIVFVVSV